jgi:hypothetical protein
MYIISTTHNELQNVNITLQKFDKPDRTVSKQYSAVWETTQYKQLLWPSRCTDPTAI